MDLEFQRQATYMTNIELPSPKNQITTCMICVAIILRIVRYMSTKKVIRLHRFFFNPLHHLIGLHFKSLKVDIKNKVA